VEALVRQLDVADHGIPAAQAVVGIDPFQHFGTAAGKIAGRQKTLFSHCEVSPARLVEADRRQPAGGRLALAAEEHATHRHHAGHDRRKRQHAGLRTFA
jgi:hypothetical protein